MQSFIRQDLLKGIREIRVQIFSTNCAKFFHPSPSPKKSAPIRPIREIRVQVFNTNCAKFLCLSPSPKSKKIRANSPNSRNSRSGFSTNCAKFFHPSPSPKTKKIRENPSNPCPGLQHKLRQIFHPSPSLKNQKKSAPIRPIREIRVQVFSTIAPNFSIHHQAPKTKKNPRQFAQSAKSAFRSSAQNAPNFSTQHQAQKPKKSAPIRPIREIRVQVFSTIAPNFSIHHQAPKPKKIRANSSNPRNSRSGFRFQSNLRQFNKMPKI